MPRPADVQAARQFDRLSPPAKTAVLVFLIGLILILALALDSGGETAFMYVTF